VILRHPKGAAPSLWSRVASSPRLLLSLGLLIIVVISSISSHTFPPSGRAEADSSHIVALYVDGQKRVVSTEAGTVGDLLSRVHVQLNTGDLVEPSSKTLINGDYFNINVYRARPVTIVDGGSTYHISSAYQSPRLLAAAAGLKLFPQDGFTKTTITNFVTDGSVGDKIVVLRSVPFTLSADGKNLELRSQPATVAQALKSAGISLGLKDQLNVPADQPLSSNLHIVVTRVSDVTTTVTETTPHQTQTTYDNTLARGTTQVKQAGSDGHRTVTYHIVYKNGVEVSRATLDVKNEVKPVTQIQVVGTHVYYSNETVAMGEQMAASRGWVNDQWDSLYQLWMHESGWNPYAKNAYSGACGIPQANPCSKIGNVNDPAAQITWGLNYIASKYGDPNHAWAFWKRNGSY
jgi:uncharacterized protein YabE (DUF348 family)